MDDKFNKSLDIIDDKITTYLPYILQDLWSLGGNPELVINLIEKNIKIKPDFNIIDLGCGKGATIIELAKRDKANYTGIDIVSEFIQAGNDYIKKESIKANILLQTKDFLAVIKESKKYDLIIFGYDTDTLGDTTKSINSIDKIKSSRGFLVFETAFKQVGYNGKEYCMENELLHQINESNMQIIDKMIWEQDYLRKINETNNALIKKRINELKEAIPEKNCIFDDYYQNQLVESEILDKYIKCVTYVLK